MDFAAVTFAAIAAICLAAGRAGRRARRDSALLAAGLEVRDTPAPRAHRRVLPACRAGLARLGRTISPRPGAELRKLLEESGSTWTPHHLQGLRAAAGLALTILA